MERAENTFQARNETLTINHIHGEKFKTKNNNNDNNNNNNNNNNKIKNIFRRTTV